MAAGADRRDDAALSIWAVSPAVTVEAPAIRLLEALRSRGATVTGPTVDVPAGPVDAVLVLLSGTEADVAASAGLEERLNPWRERLVPAVAGDRPSPAFADRSQLLLATVGVERATERVLLVARVGGPALASLYRLLNSVQEWEGGGRPDNLLLRGAAVDDALLQLNAAAAASEAFPAVPEYVAASSKRRRRRSRRALAIAAAAAAVLVAASTTALVQQRFASAATAEHVHERRHSDSVRLAGLATDALSLDPDLPWLLAAEALRSEVSVEALDSARQVLAASPAHRSVALPGLAYGLATDAESDTLALFYADGRVEVRSGEDGAQLVQLAGEGPRPDFVSLAPGGELLLIGGDGARFVDAADGETVAALAPDRLFWGWADASHALVSDGGALGRLHVADGTLEPTGTTVAATDIEQQGWSSPPGADWTYLLDGDTLVAVDLTTGRAMPGVPVPGAGDVAASEDGQQVLVTVGSGRPKLFTRGPDGLTPEDAAGFGERVTAMAGGWLVTDATGQARVVRSGQRAPAYVFSAHRGPVVGSGALAGGRFATVGGDRYLRLWSLDAERQVLPSEPPTADVLKRGPSWRMETSRPMIAFDQGSGDVTYTLQSPALAGVLDGETLERVGEESYLGDISIATRALPGGRIAVVQNSGWTGVANVMRGRLEWSREFNVDAAWNVTDTLVGASSDGERLALANRATMLAWGATGEPVQVEFTVQENPVAVLIDDDHRASVVTVSGTWYREGEETVEVVSEGQTAVAAAWGTDRVLWVLTGAGDLLAIKGDRTRNVGTVPDGLEGFALRPSGDGRHVGVIGRDNSVVVTASDGCVVAAFPRAASDGSELRDVASDGDIVWAIRADGAVIRRAILDDRGVGERLREQTPRQLTAAERAAVASATSLIGGE